jgi:hypothetical protein
VHARTILERAGAKVVGAVLNRFDPPKGGAYQYAYHYTYRYAPAGPDTEAVGQNGGGGRSESLRRLLRRT